MGEQMKRLSPSGRVYSCYSCRSGHDVHFIQARLSWEDPDRAPVHGHIQEVYDDGTVVVEDAQGQVIRLWNHDPERLARLAGANDNQIGIQLGLLLLRTKSTDGGFYLFCVCPEDLRTPCWRRRIPGIPESGQSIGFPAHFEKLRAAQQDHGLRQMANDP